MHQGTPKSSQWNSTEEFTKVDRMETVQETKRQQRFQLLRYFTTASLIMFCLVAVLLGMFYGRVARTNLITLGEKNNVALTQACANSIWAQFAPFLTSASGLGVEQIQVHPQTAGLRRAILALMEGLLVVKVKIYDIDGQTVFSTQANQIGQDKSSNAGFRSARAGQVASELTHRDTFSAFEQTIEDRDVLSSYLPIQRGGPTSPIEGVFEIYTDVTPLLENIQQMQRSVTLGVTLALAFLYAILFGIVRRADRIIRRQHTDLQAALGAAEQASRAKSAFLATMSHELRTPLNSIIGFSNQVLKNKHQTLQPQEQTYLERVRDNGLHLLQLLNDILDLSKVEAGHM